jgi:recombination protein RecA
MFGNPETTPGGRALKFYSSVRLDIRRVNTIKDATGAIGTHVRTRVVKNKIAPPFRDAEFDLMFDSGISTEGDLLDLGVKHELIEKSGAFLRYGDIVMGQGREKAKQFLLDNPDIMAELKNKILAAYSLTDSQAAEEEKPAETKNAKKSNKK